MGSLGFNIGAPICSLRDTGLSAAQQAALSKAVEEYKLLHEISRDRLEVIINRPRQSSKTFTAELIRQINEEADRRIKLDKISPLTVSRFEEQGNDDPCRRYFNLVGTKCKKKRNPPQTYRKPKVRRNRK